MYADITKIDTPSSVQAGEYVIVDVSLKNTSDSDEYLSVTAVFDSTSITFQFDYLLFMPGQTLTFRGWFVMPSKDVRITAYSHYWDGSSWIQDDRITKDIDVVVLTPQISDFKIADFNKV